MMYDPLNRTMPDLAPAQDAPSEQLGARNVVELVKRAIPYGAMLAALFVGLTLIYATNTEPTFTSSGKLLIDPGRAGALLAEQSRDSMSTSDARIDSEVEVLKSDRISFVVIDQLKLLDIPEFQATDDPLSWVMSLFRPGAEVVISGKENLPELRYAAAVFGSRLLVRRVGTSLILEVSFRSNDPERAAAITNAVMAAYISGEVETQADAARNGSLWLKSRLDELRVQAYEAMRGVERFKALGEATPAGEAQVKLAELESISSTYRRMYESFLEKLTETAQKVSYPVADARIIASASVPLSRSHPRTTLLVAFAGLLGIASGFGVAVAKQSTDRSVRTRRQVQTQAQTDILGVVSLQTLRKTSEDHRGMRHDLLEFVSTNPSSAFAQEMRTIKTSLDGASLGAKRRSIGFTSLQDADGKSTIAANVAFLYAAGGARTLLVDAASRHPTISETFAPSAGSGLIQLLDGTDAASTAVLAGSLPNLWLLPIGANVLRIALGDRIGTERADTVIEDLRATFDVVIYDLPSISSSSDARAIVPFLDGVTVVADCAVSVDELTESVAFLRDTRATVLGVVLNKATAARKSKIMKYQ